MFDMDNILLADVARKYRIAESNFNYSGYFQAMFTDARNRKTLKFYASSHIDIQFPNNL